VAPEMIPSANANAMNPKCNFKSMRETNTSPSRPHVNKIDHIAGVDGTGGNGENGGGETLNLSSVSSFTSGEFLVGPDAVETLRAVSCLGIGELKLAGGNFCDPAERDPVAEG